jgi:GT2 family glycosyltransferase
MDCDRFVYAIILAWNHLEDTIECVESLANSEYLPLQLILVDNGSTDHTKEIIQERYPSVEILRSEKNLGVSGGYNVGIAYALKQGANYILIANNDIAVDPEMIRFLVRDLDDNPQAGIAMPKIYQYYGDRNRLWCIGARWRKFPPSVKMIGTNVKDEIRYTNPQELEFVPSCCLMLRREMVEHIGLFDTGYFFYNDDWDYSIRCRQAGYTIRFVPTAKMMHKVSVSTQKSHKPAQWWSYYGRSTVRFYHKYAKNWQLSTFIVWFVIREILKGEIGRIRPFMIGVLTEQKKEKE